MKSRVSWMFFGFMTVASIGPISLAQAGEGGIASGGVPLAPVSVVIQETILAGSAPSLDLEKAVRIKAGEDLASGKVQAFFQADDGVVNGVGRKRWCIEYSSFDQFVRASSEYRDVLRGFGSVEVVQTGRCTRR